MKWSNRLIAIALCLILALGVMPVYAFASEGDVPPAETTAPTSPTEPEEPSGDGLTPEGNLTIVDDVTDSATGKEFITVVTKNGNYFYIVIDRDAKGNATVHFLNLVDERDLLELLSEEEVQDYQEQQAAKPTVPPETEPDDPAGTQPTQPAPTEPGSEFDPQMDRETMIMLALPIVVLIVGGFAAYFVFSRKKPKSAPAQQDSDDDWDYGYDLPEEDDDMSEEGGVK